MQRFLEVVDDLWYILQMVISVTAFLKCRKNFLRYTTIVTVAYFFSYFMAGSFDVSLSLYFVFLLLGTGIPCKIKSLFLGYGATIIIYVIYGLLFQDTLATMTAFVTRYAYIVVMIGVLFGNNKRFVIAPTKADLRFFVRTGLFTEISIIMLVWIRHGVGARIVTNNQPIGAGIVIALMFVVVWGYYTNQFKPFESAVYVGISVLIVALSGTRSYMLIVMFPVAMWGGAYFVDVPRHGENMQLRIGILALIIAVFLIILGTSDLGENIIKLLRLEQGLGYRENENRFVREIMSRAKWYEVLFGFGLGGNATHVPGFDVARLLASWNRKFMFYKFETRTIFHNYWYTILFKQGLTGIIGIVLFYALIFAHIGRLRTCLWSKILLWLAVIGNVISITFHISATCSMIEMLFVAYLVRLIEIEPNVQNSVFYKEDLKCKKIN